MKVFINFSTRQGLPVPGMRDVTLEGSQGQAHAHALKLIETKKAATEVEFFTLIWPRPKDETPPLSKKTMCMQSYHHTGRESAPLKFIPPF